MSFYATKVARCEAILTYDFSEKLHCVEALNRSGSLGPVDTNHRIAILGDALVKAYMCKQWIKTKRPKGKETR